MKYSRRRYGFVSALLSAARLVSAYPGAALADGETGVYLDGAQAESYDAALAAAAERSHYRAAVQKTSLGPVS